MYAIIETGGKQFRVEEGSRLRVDGLAAEEVGAALTLDKVLMVGGGAVRVGAPYLAGASVAAEVLDHGRGEKIKVFKKWRRNDSRRMRGHRQNYTTIRITSITA
jgi:large subunit ribosomal protein L21